MPKQVRFEGKIHNFPDDATDDEIRAALEPEVQSTGQRALQFAMAAGRTGLGAGKDILAGIGSGVFSTGLGTSKLLGMVPESTTLEDIGMAPEGTLQNVGMGAEQIAEFFGPGGIITKLAGKATKAPRLAKTGLEALSAAGVTGAQTGGDVEKMAVAGGLAGGLTGIGQVSEKVLRSLATKVEARQLGSSANYAHGFKPENVYKYDLGGSLQQTLNKTHAALKSRADKLRSILKGADEPVDLEDALAATEKELLGSGEAIMKNADALPEIRAALNRWQNSIAESSPSGIVNPLLANDFKRSVGNRGSWFHGTRDPSAIGEERVANALYTHVRTTIERSVKNPEVKRLNKELGELIPIEEAVIRRLPIEERQQIISMTSQLLSLPAAITGDVRQLVLPALGWVSKSRRAANILQKQATATGTTGRVAAAGASGLW